MIKVELWIDDGREEITILAATVAVPEETKPNSLWERLHQSFAARLHEKEKEG